MQKLKAGFIGFIPFTAKGEEYYKLLEDYGKLGYKGVEQANVLLEGDFDANLARIKGYGLEPICVPLMKMPGMPEPDIDDLVAKAHKLGVTRLVTYMSVAANYRFGMGQGTPSYDEVMTQIEEFEQTATRAKAEGLQFMFHNHDAEFTTVVNGETPFELMIKNTENLTFELDVGWVTYGGVDPVNLIHRLGKRIGALHIKDFVPGKVEQRPGNGIIMPRFTTPGTGILNLSGVLEAGVAIGQEWAIIEQDFQRNLTTRETLTAAYLNMKETGFVE